ncbi:MAG TPA: hypothetical protein VN521_04615 [Negativicutes bacterium]|nr:hypothetical protein [Negativicutes bacterium]
MHGIQQYVKLFRLSGAVTLSAELGDERVRHLFYVDLVLFEARQVERLSARTKRFSGIRL